MALQAGITQATLPADPTLDLLDGSEAIELSAELADTEVARRYLARPDAARVQRLAWPALAVAALLAALGSLAPLLGAPGLALLWLGAAGLGAAGLICRREWAAATQLTIGAAADADLPSLSDAVPLPRFPLVRGRADGLGYELLFTASMTGELAQDGRSTRLERLIGEAAPTSELCGVHALPIPRGASIRLTLEPLTFIIRSVRPARQSPPSLLPRLERGAVLGAALSLAGHLGVLALVAALPPPLPRFGPAGPGLVRSVRATLPGGPARVPGALGAFGRGAAREHALGSGPIAARPISGPRTWRGLTRLRGPRDNPDPHLVRELARGAASNAGVLSMLGRSELVRPGGALDGGTRRALDDLWPVAGNEIGEAYGVGGLGLVGIGRGGGGRGEGTIGVSIGEAGCWGSCGFEGTNGYETLATIGLGGGRGSGGCGGRGGCAIGALRGRRARAPCIGGDRDCDLGTGRAEVRGSLDRNIVRAVIRRHLSEVRYCYGKELQTLRAEGRVVLRFFIAPSGAVVSASTSESTLGAPEVEQCVAQAARRWLFPSPRGGGMVEVRYPFMFRTP